MDVSRHRVRLAGGGGRGGLGGSQGTNMMSSDRTHVGTDARWITAQTCLVWRGS